MSAKMRKIFKSKKKSGDSKNAPDSDTKSESFVDAERIRINGLKNRTSNSLGEIPQTYQHRLSISTFSSDRDYEAGDRSSTVSRRSFCQSTTASNVHQNCDSERRDSMNYSFAKMSLSKAKDQLESELKWRTTALNKIAQMNMELEMTEQEIRKHRKENESSEKTVMEMESKLHQLRKEILAVEVKNSNLRHQHQLETDQEAARVFNQDSGQQKRKERDYRSLLNDLTNHGTLVERAADSVSEYLNTELLTSLESLEFLSGQLDDHSQLQQRHPAIVKLSDSFKTLCMSICVMASDIRITELFVNNQKSKNNMVEDAVSKIAMVTDDVMAEYHYILKNFYEGKSQQDMLDKLADELDAGIKECLAVINDMTIIKC